MSADAVAAPRLSLNVRYNRNVQETSGEEEESQVEILEEEEHHADLGPQRAGPHTQNKPAANNRRRLKAAAVTLGGFYLLILAALFIRYTLLQTRYDQLSNNYTQLQEEVNQLKDRTKVTLLQTRYDQLSNNYTQLKDEVKQLKDRIKVLKVCPDGWTRSGCRCYFKSKEKKNWDDSLADCKKIGADRLSLTTTRNRQWRWGRSGRTLETGGDGRSSGTEFFGREGTELCRSVTPDLAGVELQGLWRVLQEDQSPDHARFDTPERLRPVWEAPGAHGEPEAPPARPPGHGVLLRRLDGQSMESG
ncbi:uncharacterized protein LOC116679045, partial [Etheostoma spectabile]|uniref:uncharacterized protein LOC116679045 n=1 Tax=Etheostoma spectabile TaxID=54343 RepID=UPI0013AFED0C